MTQIAGWIPSEKMVVEIVIVMAAVGHMKLTALS